jgi:hypothetical protein
MREFIAGFELMNALNQTINNITRRLEVLRELNAKWDEDISEVNRDIERLQLCVEQLNYRIGVLHPATQYQTLCGPKCPHPAQFCPLRQCGFHVDESSSSSSDDMDDEKTSD